MINAIGKLFVFVHLAVSVFALTVAAGIFFQKIDWGWKEPRKELGLYRVPSEIDKRIAVHAQASEAVKALKNVSPGQTALLAAERQFPANHLFYVAELEKLRTGPDPLVVKAVKYTNGVLELDQPVIGKPLVTEAVPGLDKCLTGYEAELAALQKDLGSVTDEIAKWIEKEKELTFRLNGKDDTGKIVKLGLYALLEEEAKAQEQARFEKNYLEPIWVRTLRDAAIHQQRQARLQATLSRVLKQDEGNQ